MNNVNKLDSYPISKNHAHTDMHPVFAQLFTFTKDITDYVYVKLVCIWPFKRSKMWKWT